MCGEKIDNRMQWILGLEELEKTKENIPVYYTDYEICSEVRISGVLTYSNGMIECSLYQESDTDGLFTYILRIKHIQKVFEYNENNYTKDGYYFKEGLIGEIIALFSFYLQARFYLKATITGEMSATSLRSRFENKFLYRKINNDLTCLNLEMFSNQDRNWNNCGLVEFLNLIKELGQNYHQNLIQSLHWYSEGIKEIGTDHELFFIKLVSSVEALLDITGTESDGLAQKLHDLHGANTFDTDEWVQIERWLKNRMIRRRFTEFYINHSIGFTSAVPKEAAHCYIPGEQIPEYIKRIYDARSAYLHTGKPMFLSNDMRNDEMKKWDVDPIMGMSADRKKIPEKEKLPRLRWFERITNYAVKHYLQEISKQ